MSGSDTISEALPAGERRLGPFSLQELIGRGASGEVWRAIHLDLGIPVAVKVLNVARGQEPGLLEAFRNEIRAVAGLDHPGIISLFDHGVLGEGCAEIGTPGSPFLVMELAEGGSIKSRCGRLPWEAAQQILVELLDALAHAHARGVIHRDIKPGNVLIGGLRPGIKLTDFGLAQLFETGVAGPDDVAGTPAYMAPEQFHGHARDLGPWTDLYALGCFAWALVCGAPPFGRESPLEARRGHLFRPLPGLDAGVPVPVGFDAWLHRLLEKEPGRRFRRAADATWALLSLSGNLVQPLVAPTSEGGEVPTVLVGPGPISTTSQRSSASSGEVRLLAETTLSGSFTGAPTSWREPMSGSWTLTGTDIPTEPDEETSAVYVIHQALLSSRPPPPADWRRPGDELPRPATLGAVGLQLFGLRGLPMIGRERERDALWATLLEVCAQERPAAVLLSGPAGCGKSRLAEWLCERAHEVGAACVLRAQHGSHGGPSDGLPGMLRRALRAQGLAGDELLRRVAAALALQGVSDPVEVATVAAFVQGEAEGGEDGEAPPGAVRFSSPAERYAVLRRFLLRATRERPAIVWMDDVAWGLDALRFVAALLDAADAEPAPILLVLTAREESLGERPVEAEQLRQLELAGRLRRQEVGPLPPDRQRELVASLLSLEGELARAVEERTAGNPLFAVQLVGDWVQRGLLEPTPRGFRLRGDPSRVLPPDLSHVWQERVRRLLAEGRSEHAREALELAATLGQDVEPAEWEAVCREAGFEAPWDLVERLVAERLARPAEGGFRSGFSFVHGMLRESLLDEARAEGRLAAHHRRAAAALSGMRDTAGWLALAERVGRHHLEGEDAEGALGPLLDAARRRVSGADYRAAEVLLLERDRALAMAGLAEGDRRQADGEIPWVQALYNQGRFSEAEERARRLVERAASHGWAEHGRNGRFALAHLSRMRGLYAEAIAEQDRLEPEARAAGDQELLLRILREKGRIRMDQGDPVAAGAALQEAFRLALALGVADLEGICLRDLSNLHLRAGRHALALQHMKAARARFARSGNRWGIADACNMLGEVDRELGRLDRAEARYRESIARFEAIGSFDVIIPNLNLANVLLLRGRLDEARTILQGCVAFARRVRSRHLEAMAWGLLLVRSASAGDWESWGPEWASLEQLMAAADCVEMDLAASLELAGQRAAAVGANGPALDALRLSATCWTTLRRPSDAARAQAEGERVRREGLP